MKVINDLLNINNMKIVQDTDYFNFSLDSVLLSNYIEPKKGDKIIDFCSGNCPVPMILSTKTKDKIYAVELQKEVYKLGLESIKLNKLEKQIELLNMDVKDLCDKFETDTLSSLPILISKEAMSLTSDSMQTLSNKGDENKFTDKKVVFPRDAIIDQLTHVNDFSDEYMDYRHL